MESVQAGTSRAPSGAHWASHRLAVAGTVLLVLGMLPLETVVRRYLFAESLQFCVFAMAVPALLVLGTRRMPRRGLLPLRGALAVVVVFAGLCVLWRLPPVLDALSRHPILQVPELLTLLPAGTALWLQLVSSPSSAARLARPQRAAVAALAMWSNWVIAYVLGFANHAVVHAYAQSGAVADQELSAALTWAVSAACFLPVICVTMVTWLRDGGAPGAGGMAEAEQRPIARGVAPVRGWGRALRSR